MVDLKLKQKNVAELKQNYEDVYNKYLIEKFNSDPTKYDNCLDKMDKIILKLRKHLSDDDVASLLSDFPL